MLPKYAQNSIQLSKWYQVPCRSCTGVDGLSNFAGFHPPLSPKRLSTTSHSVGLSHVFLVIPLFPQGSTSRILLLLLLPLPLPLPLKNQKSAWNVRRNSVKFMVYQGPRAGSESTGAGQSAALVEASLLFFYALKPSKACQCQALDDDVVRVNYMPQLFTTEQKSFLQIEGESLSITPWPRRPQGDG